MLAGLLFIGGGAAIYLSQPQQPGPTDVANLPSAGRSLPVFVQETPTPIPTPVPSPTPIPTFDLSSPTPDPFASPTPDPFATPTPGLTPTPTVTPTTGPVATEARFGWEQRAAFRVAFSDASRGSITSWLWDFGDGNTSTDRSPRHDYPGPGQYTVVLTVDGPNGSATRARQITVANPATPTPTPAPTTQARFNFSQQNGTLNVQFNDNSTGSPTSWSWNFGDGGSSTEQSPSHTYAGPGTYAVTLSISGPNGESQRTRNVTVEAVGPPPPNDQFSCDRSQEMKLTCTANLANASYEWSSSDQATNPGGNTGQQVVFEYPLFAGDSTVNITLTVTVDGVSNTRSKQVTVKVPDQPPPEEP